ncbi:hypothetical protein LZ31DRAFT_601216 [Colletotrichum somersetense]|nr:hypothetical protein LZ31DRAFT_601216 [Colletotrichum somersetense]
MSRLEAVTSSICLLGDQVIRHFSRLRLRTRLLIIPTLIVLLTLCLSGTPGLRRIGLLYNEPNRPARNVNLTRWEWVRPRPGHLIPPKIWQIMIPKERSDNSPVKPDKLKETATWLAMNTDYT